MTLSLPRQGHTAGNLEGLRGVILHVARHRLLLVVVWCARATGARGTKTVAWRCSSVYRFLVALALLRSTFGAFGIDRSGDEDRTAASDGPDLGTFEHAATTLQVRHGQT